MKKLLALLVFVPSLAAAQTPSPIAGYVLTYYQLKSGVLTVVGRDTFAGSSVNCDQAPPTTTDTVNPTRAVWDDPDRTGRTCQFVLPSNSALASLPMGVSYEAGLTAVKSATEISAESLPHAVFSKVLLPPTTLELIK